MDPSVPTPVNRYLVRQNSEAGLVNTKLLFNCIGNQKLIVTDPPYMFFRLNRNLSPPFCIGATQSAPKLGSNKWKGFLAL